MPRNDDQSQYSDDDEFDARDDGYEEDEAVTDSEPRQRKRRAAAPPPKSSWWKTLLILFGVSGLMMALCCGGGIWYASKSFDFNDDPVKAAAVQKEIVDLQILPELKPQGSMAMNLGVFQMKLVAYTSANSESMMLMEMQVAGQTEDQMQQSFRQQGQKQNDHFQMESSETRKLKVMGVERDFLFAKGKIQQPGGAAIPARQVTGMFPSKNGMGYLLLNASEDNYQEAAVIQMIESIQK